MSIEQVRIEVKQNDFSLVPVKEVKINPKNRNKHSKEQIDNLCKIILYEGYRDPVIISKRSGLLVCGHLRLAAVKKLKMKEIPAVFQDFISDEEEGVFGTNHNTIGRQSELDMSGINEDIASYGPDFDLDLMGIPGLTIDVADKLDPQCDEDEVPEIKESFVKLGDIWQLGNHRLMCGDSTSIDAVEKLMAGEKVDMVFTDPPYNIDYSPEERAIGGRAQSKNQLGKIENDNMSDDSFYDFLSGVNSTILIACREGAPIYQCAPIGMNNLQYLRAWSDAKFHYSDGLIWLKNNHSISRKDYHPKHEVIHYGWTQGSHSWFGGRDKFSVFECSREKVTEYKHPTQKPIELSEHFITNSSNKNDKVLDLFGGSGSTLIACEKTNRKCFMMELDPHYCGVIIERWQKYTGKKAERIYPAQEPVNSLEVTPEEIQTYKEVMKKNHTDNLSQIVNATNGTEQKKSQLKFSQPKGKKKKNGKTKT